MVYGRSGWKHTNLLSNAIQYARRGGRVEISTKNVECGGNRFVFMLPLSQACE